MTIRELIEKSEKEVAVYAIDGNLNAIILDREQAFSRMMIEPPRLHQ